MSPSRRRSPLGTLLWSLAIALVAAGLLVLSLIPLARAPENGAGGQLVGQPAPALEGETLAGDSWTHDDDRLLWVNFWAMSCPPCRSEMPAMQRISELRPDDLVVLGVNWGEERGAVAEFVERLGIGYPILLDPRRENFDRWATGGWLPRHYFVRDGAVVHEVIGELRPNDMAGLLTRLLAD